MKRRALLGLPCVLAASSVAAATLPRHSACYERAYDARHLAAHPHQKVRRIGAVYSVSYGEVQVHLDVWLRGDPVHYSMYADCVPEGAGQRCRTDFDKGSWRIEATASGGLLVTNDDFWVNPDASDSQTILPSGLRLHAAPDDRSWSLRRLKTCPND